MIDRCKRKRRDADGGFTLVECLCGIVIIVVGVLAVFSLMDVGLRLQTESRDSVNATMMAKSKIEHLRNTSASSAELCPGGNLNADVSGYNDLPDPRFRRRWLISNGPDNTRVVTVSVVPNVQGMRLPPIQIITLMPRPSVAC